MPSVAWGSFSNLFPALWRLSNVDIWKMIKLLFLASAMSLFDCLWRDDMDRSRTHSSGKRSTISWNAKRRYLQLCNNLSRTSYPIRAVWYVLLSHRTKRFVNLFIKDFDSRNENAAKKFWRSYPSHRNYLLFLFIHRGRTASDDAGEPSIPSKIQ